jgi:hypothetical protein
MPNDSNKKSLRPPKQWFDKKCAEVKAGNPDYTEEQVNATVGSIWYKEMSKHQKSERREDEGKTYGKVPEKEIKKSLFPLLMKKSQKVVHRAEEQLTAQESSIPAIVCEYFDKEGVFEELRVVTAKEVLEDPEKFDSRTFGLLIRNLGKKLSYEYGVDDQLKCAQVIIDLAEELEERLREEKDARSKLEEERVIGVPLEDNWQKKKEYFMGKSIMNLPVDEEGIQDYLSDAEVVEEKE